MEYNRAVKLASGRRVSGYYPRLVLASSWYVSRTRATQRQPIIGGYPQARRGARPMANLIWLDKVRGGQSAKFLHARAPFD
jgi:hypothetical protein